MEGSTSIDQTNPFAAPLQGERELSNPESQWRTLNDTETIQAGDIVKDIENGEYREVCEDSFDGLLIGMTAAHCRNHFGSINDILRPVR